MVLVALKNLVIRVFSSGRKAQAEPSIAASTFFAADALSDPDMPFAISPRSSAVISPILNLVTRMPVITASFFFAFLITLFPIYSWLAQDISLSASPLSITGDIVMASTQLCSQPQTICNYNDYIVNLSRHA